MSALADYRFCPRCAAPLEDRILNGGARRACAADGCGFVYWDNPVPVVAALVEHEGAIVLANNVEWPEHLYGLITGFLEKEETPEQGVLREVREELGLDGRVESLIGLYPFARMNQVILAFHVKGEGTLVPGAELRAVKRIAPDRLRPWEFGTGLAVRDWLNRRQQK
jgi:NADH pyrophosphatase NudC (nudix superfamily)